ncbi:MAG: DUF72 domain-containing protein [Candidatus Bathyarchaeia archaeon]
MESFVGTSGWLYSWNPGGSLDWFAKASGLNAVELNMSFYRFPSPRAVESWALKGKGLRWAIKANRLITHSCRLKGKALGLWERFHGLFAPLEPSIDFYLFQLPPSITPASKGAIEAFAEATGLRERFALEVRNEEWFREEHLEWASGLGITWVGVDSPDLPIDVFNMNGLVYHRMHGRSAWYSHYYSDEELADVARRILEARPRRAYVFFNNDHAMLKNARRMLAMLSEKARRGPSGSSRAKPASAQ